MLKIAVSATLILLAACSGPGNPIPSQEWKGWVINVEARPWPVRQGMNEFLVLISDRNGHRPRENFLVHIRTKASDWIQAIPDGTIGVYRRALPVKDMEQPVLFVRLKKGDEVGELRFSLKPH